MARAFDPGQDSKDAAGLVADEDRREQGTGPETEPAAEAERVEGGPQLATGVGAEAFAESHAQTAVGGFGGLLNHEKHEKHEKGKGRWLAAF